MTTKQLKTLTIVIQAAVGTLLFFLGMWIGSKGLEALYHITVGVLCSFIGAGLYIAYLELKERMK